MTLTAAILLVLALAASAPILHRVLGRATHWLLAAAAGYVAARLGMRFSDAAAGVEIIESYTWVESMGLTFSLRADGLGLMLAVLVSGIGSLILIYAGDYLRGRAELGLFYSYLLLFMASMLGVALADNAILLFICWELTSLSSYLLIGFDHERPSARSAALQALLVTGIGGLALLVGLLFLGHVCGNYELSAMVERSATVRAHGLYVPILVLVVIGAATKSAQFPFHFWLPSAMEAPSPVSAYLHSATMVKAGVFLLARMTPILGGTASWQTTLTLIGGATMLIGAAFSLSSAGLKRILAYSTVSTLGILTMLIGIGTPAAIMAAVVYLIAHAFYKGALFMLAGVISHATGEYDADRLGGLGRAMPMSAAVGALAGLSMAGIPPMFGFVGKELLYEAGMDASPWWIVVTAAFLATHMVLFVVPLRVGLRPFFGNGRSFVNRPHEGALGMWLGPLILAVGGAAGGIFVTVIGERVVYPTVGAIIGMEQSRALPALKLWHGLTPALALSAATLIGGMILFSRRTAIVHALSRLSRFEQFGPSAAYERMLTGINHIATMQTRVIQSGHLRRYLLIILTTAVALIGLNLDSSFDMLQAVDFSNVQPQFVVVCVLILLGALSAVRSRTRLGAVASLGAVGYGVALIFAYFGAPDLAMTQFLIETLIVILFVLVLYHLPAFSIYSSRASRSFDATIAIAFGGLMSWLTLSAATIESHSRISDYFAEHSVSDAHGRNVVNVILVDFRAIDTLGEITVLAVAAVGVYALLRIRRRREEAGG
ncbi:MAG: putative monovalent cation/H+ antiporter subunit A [Phycisphaerae bacterium]|nr:putative monovalent cation/H+ antiporter subunit A [Phycisphaerae bacterium]